MTDPHIGHEHISKTYDAELGRLIEEIVRMGKLAAEQLAAAMDAVSLRDSALAQRVVAGDAQIDALEREVGHDALRLLALRQPIARDLREIMAALRNAADIERIGDYAANVAKRALALNQGPAAPIAQGLSALAELAGVLLRDVLTAYRERDASRALTVWERDADLDARYTDLVRGIIAYMTESPANITSGTHLMFMAKNIERIGDHATNVAESIFFLVHGTPIAEARRKADESNTIT